MIDSAPVETKTAMSEPRKVGRPLTIGRLPYTHPDTGAKRWEIFAEFQGTGIGRIVMDDVATVEDALRIENRLTNVVVPSVAFEEVVTQHGRNQYQDGHSEGYGEGVLEGRAQAEAEARVKVAAEASALPASAGCGDPWAPRCYATGGDDDDRDGVPLSVTEARRVELRGNVETIIADLVGYAAPAHSGYELARKLATVVTAFSTESDSALRDLYRALALVLASAINEGE